MHFNTVALMALASVAMASKDELAKRQSINTVEVSVLAVLATALPPSLVSIGITNPAEVGAIIASSFSAGQTPGWYSALPSDVKSYLPILYAEQTATTATPSSTGTPAPSSSSSAVVVTSTVVSTTSIATVGTASATISPSGNRTVVSTVHSPTLSQTNLGGESSTAAGSSAAAASASSTTHTGGASLPTAGMGAGLAGVMGVLGMLAL